MHATRMGKAEHPNDVIILDSAYHGHTQGLVDISPYKWYQAIDGVVILGLRLDWSALSVVSFIGCFALRFR